jgi:hypothetical protein
MQIQRNHIGGGEPVLREPGKKEFVDHALAGLTDAALFRLMATLGGNLYSKSEWPKEK